MITNVLLAIIAVLLGVGIFKIHRLSEALGVEDTLTKREDAYRASKYLD